MKVEFVVQQEKEKSGEKKWDTNKFHWPAGLSVSGERNTAEIRLCTEFCNKYKF